MKNDTYYFSHDSNAKDDPKCVMLIEQLGCEGYGIFWILIETLRAQPDYKYPFNLISALARRYNTSAEKMTTVVKSYGLFKIEEDQFFSLRLMRAMEEYNTKRLKYIEAGSKGGQASVKHRLSNGQAIKGKERKGNKIKGKKENAPPTLEEVIEYFLQHQYTQQAAEKAFEYYATNGWKDSQGKPVLNWKQKMISVWFKPEHQISGTKKETMADKMGRV